MRNYFYSADGSVSGSCRKNTIDVTWIYWTNCCDQWALWQRSCSMYEHRLVWILSTSQHIQRNCHSGSDSLSWCELNICIHFLSISTEPFTPSPCPEPVSDLLSPIEKTLYPVCLKFARSCRHHYQQPELKFSIDKSNCNTNCNTSSFHCIDWIINKIW